MRLPPSLFLTKCLLILALTFPLNAHANTDELTFFRIGTGGIDGIYYPMGGLIASTISNPPGTRDCVRGGKCGVPGLIAVAKSSDGSISNLNGLLNGDLDSAFIQADVLYNAYLGKGPFEGKAPLDELRVLSSLFDESIHIVVQKDKNIKEMKDLKGKRISLGVKNSDAFIESQLLLNAFNIKANEINAFNLDNETSANALRNDEIDAFFMVSGYPSRIISELASEGLIDLLSLPSEIAKDLTDEHKFLTRDLIPAEIYPNIGQVETLSIATIWVTTKNLDEQLAYGILDALWHENNRAAFENTIEAAKGVSYSNAFAGVRTPIHSGAMLFHEQQEILKSQRILSLDQPEIGFFESLFEATADEPDQ